MSDFKTKMHQKILDFGPKSTIRLDPAGGAYSAPQTS